MAHVDDMPKVPDSLWERIRARPDRAPEHIALAAAARFADPAERWAAQMLPHHTPAEAAKIARRKHVRLAQAEGAVMGIGGALTAPADLAALIWIQGRMVFFIAASYGFDPHHPMRPAELLALQRLYDTPQHAREALDGIGTHMALRYVQTRKDPDRDLTSVLLRVAGRYAVRRASRRILPFISSPVAAAQNGKVVSALAERAIAYYGGT
jgi:EcsC protein family